MKTRYASVTHGFIFGTALVFLSLLPSVSFANVSYQVAPLVIDAEVEARDIISKVITITNNGDQPVTVYPSVNNISIDAGGTIQKFFSPVDSDRTVSLTSWIEISRMGIDLPIGGSKTVDLTLRINPNPVPGVYHAFVGFGYGRNRDEAEAQVASGRAPGTILTVTLDDKKLEILKLSRFIIDRFVTGGENQAALYTIKNPGDEVLVPSGEIIFYNSKGAEVGNLPVNAEGKAIPPGEEYQFTAEVPVHGLFGKYKAFLNVEYGNNQQASVQDTSFFYVLPLKTLLLIFGVVAVFVIISALYIHKRYFDVDVEMVDDSEHLPLHHRPTYSDPLHHDIDLTKK